MEDPKRRRELLEREQASAMFVHQLLLGSCNGAVVDGKKLDRTMFGTLIDRIEARMVQIDDELEKLK